MSTVISVWHFLHQTGSARASVVGVTRSSFRLPHRGHTRKPPLLTSILSKLASAVNDFASFPKNNIVTDPQRIKKAQRFRFRFGRRTVRLQSGSRYLTTRQAPNSFACRASS